MSMERERAKHALEVIGGLNPSGKYASYVKGLPAAILNNGFGQAMATLLSAANGKSASEDDHRLLFNHMQSWLCRNDPRAPYRSDSVPDANSTELMNRITNSEQTAYIQAQAEAMAYLVWLKKFAKAFLDDSTTGTRQTEEDEQ